MNEKINDLAHKFNMTVDNLFNIFIREQKILNFEFMLISILFFIIAYESYKYKDLLFESKLFFYIAFTLEISLSFGFLLVSIMHSINPEYHALMRIINLIKES